MFGHPDDNNSAINGRPSAGTPPHGAMGGPAGQTSSAPAVNDDLLGDFVMEKPIHSAKSAINPTKPGSSGSSVAQDELLSIKQQALQQLSPLVDHLVQTPEEKFRTTMMLIQASDNQGLLKEAYAAAQGITDEKVKAQALLDIVNEINYFTQQTEEQTR